MTLQGLYLIKMENIPLGGILFPKTSGVFAIAIAGSIKIHQRH